MRRKYGSGSITPKGHVRVNGQMEHRRVWEKHNGPVPAGFFVHHINGDGMDNRIENLTLVDALTHKRIHGGCKLIDGKWWKPCRKCGELKEIESGYYRRPDGISSWCKTCCIKNAVENKRKRRCEF